MGAIVTTLEAGTYELRASVFDGVTTTEVVGVWRGDHEPEPGLRAGHLPDGSVRFELTADGLPTGVFVIRR